MYKRKRQQSFSQKKKVSLKLIVHYDDTLLFWVVTSLPTINFTLTTFCEIDTRTPNKEIKWKYLRQKWYIYKLRTASDVRHSPRRCSQTFQKLKETCKVGKCKGIHSTLPDCQTTFDFKNIQGCRTTCM